MRAMLLTQYRFVEELPLSPVEMTKPKPGPDQIRIRVQLCGVCHTDLHIVEGDIHPSVLPIVPGHQVVGIIGPNGAGKSSLVGCPGFTLPVGSAAIA